MEWTNYVRFVVALVFVLGLIGGLTFLLRRLGLAGAVAVSRPKKAQRRLSVIETLPLDGKRRVVLLKCDDREHLVLLGQSQDLVLGAPTSAPASSDPMAAEPQPHGSELPLSSPSQPTAGVSQ